MDNVFSMLRDNNVVVNISWLSDCFQYLVDSIQEFNSQPTSKQYEYVIEQWLFSNLNELPCPCLPTDQVLFSKITILNGVFCLQMNSIVDVGCSFYSQYKKLSKTVNENVAVTDEIETQGVWEPKPKRMLFVELTDGVSHIQGMEYHPIQALYPLLPPGSKVKISGPIECRNGVLLLTEDNFVLLGGGVEALSDTNSVINVVSRCLNLVSISDGQRPSISSASSVAPVPLNTNLTVTTSVAPSRPSTNPARQRQVKPIKSSTPLKSDVIEDDDFMDDLLLAAALDNERSMELEEESKLHQGQPVEAVELQEEVINISDSTSATLSPLNDHVLIGQHRFNRRKVIESDSDDDGVVNGCQVVSMESIFAASKESTPVDPESLLSHSVQYNVDVTPDDVHERSFVDATPEPMESDAIVNFGEEDFDIFGGDDSPSSSSQNLFPSQGVVVSKFGLNNETSEVTVIVMADDTNGFSVMATLASPDNDDLNNGSCPFIYLSQFKQQMEFITCAQFFLVRACVMTLTSKLTTNSGAYWSLTVRINDGTESIEVMLSDSFIAGKLAFTAAQVQKAKKYSDGSTINAVKENNTKFRNLLMNGYEMMKIEFYPKHLHKLPHLINMVQFTDKHFQLLLSSCIV